MVDTTALVVTVTGTNPVTVELGGSYTDEVQQQQMLQELLALLQLVQLTQVL